MKIVFNMAFTMVFAALTTMSKGSGQSAFDENSLNVSQFVTLTETFLGNEPTKEAFTMLTKYVKDGYEETEEEKMERLMKVATSFFHILVFLECRY